MGRLYVGQRRFGGSRLVLHNPSGEPRVVEVFRLAGGSLVAVDTVSLAPVSQMSITIEVRPDRSRY